MSVINQDNIMILIQGAGIAGLTLAALLEKAGKAYCIVERATELAPVGAGLVLQPNARAVLASLGLEARVIESGCWLEAMSLGPVRHARRLAFNEAQAALGVHRAALHSALLSGVPPERIRLGLSVAQWRPGESGVTVQLSNGESIMANYLIGADGMKSAIRERLRGLDDLRSSGQWCWRSVLPDQPFGAEGFELFNGRFRLGVIPMGGRQTYTYWVESGHEGQPVPGPPGVEVLQNFARQAPGLAESWAAVSAWLCHPLDDRPVYWGQGRVALIGDAAHPVTPNMGQGAALGMEDAWHLNQLFAIDAIDPARALAGKRQARVQTIRRGSWLAGRIAHCRSGPLQWARDQFFIRMPATRLLRAQSELANQFIREMNHDYD